MLNRRVKFILLILLISLVNKGYCLDIDRVKVYFLNGDYKSAVLEGEKILANRSKSFDLGELYYILGLSYLKEGNYLRASDIFEILLKEFKDGGFIEEAKLGLGDTYFLRQEFRKAKDYYQELINNNPHTKFKAQIYYRLSLIGFKTGDTQLAKEYLDKLKQEFPLNPESGQNRDLSNLMDSPSDIYYTVQVGSFSNITNAKNLTKELIQNGYPAYIEEVSFQGKMSYRVRIGKLHLRREAVDLERKLTLEGYPTKICP